jgi:protein-L-isoaspartate(D-aspartate) O-methyltransferase
MLAEPLDQASIHAEAQPTAADRALVVDGGSGYLPALLEGLAGSVAVVSPAEALKGARGSDVTLLLIDGAVEQVPAALERRLADGARVIGGMIDEGVTRLAIGRKVAGAISWLPLAEMGIPRLAAFDKPKAWSF